MKGTANQIIQWLLNQDREKQFEIKEYKDKRTLTQNKYYWELLNQLSTKMRIPSIELHEELIRKSCPFEEYLVPENADLRALEYYDTKYKIEKNGKVFQAIRVYLGSSKLHSGEFTILLDNLIEECKLQNIETLTPNQLQEMREREKEYERKNTSNKDNHKHL